MARPTVTREKLERTALRLFAENSIGGTSIRDIAEAAGVSQGAMYRHYASKDALVEHLFVSNYLALAGDLDAIRADTPDLQNGLLRMVRVFCALFDRDPDLFRFLLLVQHGQLDRLPEGMRTPVHVVVDLLSDAETAGDLTPGPVQLRAAMVMGIVLQAATFHVYGRLSGGLTPLAPTLARACLAAARTPAQDPEI